MTVRTPLVVVGGLRKNLPAADSLQVGTGIVPSAAGALTLGGSVATSVTIGAVGITTTVLGDFTVDGVETIVGTSTYEDNVTFEGNTTVGNAATDTLTLTAVIAGDMTFIKEVDHTIKVGDSTTADTVGGALTIEAGDGGATNANGGALTLDAGALAGSGTGGAVLLGATNAGSIGIGASGITTTITGGLTQLTGAVSLTGNAASSLTTSSGALTLTSAAAATWSTGAGNLTINGAGSLLLQGGGNTAVTIDGSGDAVYAGAHDFGGATSLEIPSGASPTVDATGEIALDTSITNHSPMITFYDGTNAQNVVSLLPADLTSTDGHAIVYDAAGSKFKMAAVSSDSQNSKYTAASIISTSGNCVCVTSNDTYADTDSEVEATSYFSGVYKGNGNEIITDGVVDALNFTTEGGTPTVGQPCWLAGASEDASSGSGKLRGTAPTASGNFLAEVGICVDVSGYAGSKTCKVFLAPKAILAL